jgi:putative transcriptional regulator
MASFRLDTNKPPQLTSDEREQLEVLTDAQITAAALADEDNPPLTQSELRRLRSARLDD